MSWYNIMTKKGTGEVDRVDDFEKHSHTKYAVCQCGERIESKVEYRHRDNGIIVAADFVCPNEKCQAEFALWYVGGNGNTHRAMKKQSKAVSP